MRILFVSATLPPEGTATAGIIGNIMIEMMKRGENVSGLTFKTSMSSATVSRWENIKFYHAEYVREYGFESNSLSDTFFKIKRRIYDFTHRTAMRPYKDLAVVALVEALEKMDADSNYDIIIASAAFYDAVEAVRRYRERVNGSRNAKYVFYQLDPLQENLAFKKVDSEWLESYEREIYSQADHVFTTNEIYKIKVTKQWPVENVTAVDFPCVDMNLSTRLSSLKKDEEEIRCVYAGMLNEQIRDATVVLKILSRIKNPHISFYFIGSGQEDLLQQYSEGPLAGRLHLMGSMSALECENWLLSADVLLIIGNNVINQVPSKVFSYMSYGLPIVATCKIPDCSSRSYLKEIPNALIVEESGQEKNMERLVIQIESFITKYAGTRLVTKQIEKYAYKYTPEYIVGTFISSFKELA